MTARSSLLTRSLRSTIFLRPNGLSREPRATCCGLARMTRRFKPTCEHSCTPPHENSVPEVRLGTPSSPFPLQPLLLQVQLPFDQAQYLIINVPLIAQADDGGAFCFQHF